MSMQAIQVLEPGPASGLGLATIPIPKLTLDHDILVRVRAVALNPADTKWRDKEGRLLGFDASGIVEEAGPQARFKKGDEVLYAGSFIRPGSNAQYQLVDARIVGHKPSTIDWVEAAALPLVNLTAWEAFEDHFNLKPDGTNANEILLIVNGAGGVGTAAIQLARKVSIRISSADGAHAHTSALVWISK
jgi:NADPH:quinone reductase